MRAPEALVRGSFISDQEDPVAQDRLAQQRSSNPLGDFEALAAEPGPQGQPEAEGRTGVLPFPYAASIRASLENEQISAARSLLKLALSQNPREPSLAGLQKILAPARVTTSPRRRDGDRTAELQWLAVHKESYRGRWVAVSEEGLLAHARSLKELMAELKSSPPPRAPLVCRIDDLP